MCAPANFYFILPTQRHNRSQFSTLTTCCTPSVGSCNAPACVRVLSDSRAALSRGVGCGVTFSCRAALSCGLCWFSFFVLYSLFPLNLRIVLIFMFQSCTDGAYFPPLIECMGPATTQCHAVSLGEMIFFALYFGRVSFLRKIPFNRETLLCKLPPTGRRVCHQI